MYVRIREISTVSKSDSRVNDLALNISKTAFIQELRQMIAKELDIAEEKQCLYYMGKLLVDDHRIVDYNIKLNDVIQLTVKIKTEDVSKSTIVKEENSGPVPAQSLYYKIGDKVDFRDLDNGYWFEAKITKITCDRNIKQPQESDLRYRVEIDRGEEIDYAKELTSDDIRPRAWYTYPMLELKENMIVLANYNIEEPKKRGFWFHLKIQKVERNTINGVLMLAPDSFLDNCTVIYPKEVMKIPEPVLITDREDDHPDDIPLRKVAYYCEYCRDDLKRKCKHCGCKVCSLKTNPKTLLLCDDCDIGYHMACLDPPITEFPEEDEWYCPACKIDRDEIVQPGKKLKPSAKRSKMPSNSKTTNKDRDWGKGMACVGRTTECTIVPKNHYGPVPGVEVGTRWKFRMQVSEAGIHRAPVAGIHGREKDGAYSIVLSRGYEDDVDNGEEFYYTGSGGRDLSGNKRVSGQSCDQELTRENKALALNCNVKFSNTGAEAADWRKGKPVRVVRDSKLGKHSKYAPKEGYRYDGIYKVVKYFSQTGKSGHLVWRYLMRRDDPAPAPWTKKGQELDVIYPPGYKDALEAKNKDKTKQEDTDDENSKKSSNTRNKRKVKSADVSGSSNAATPPSPKKPKLQRPVPYEITEELTKLIQDDAPNEKVWRELRESTNEGKQKFLAAVEEAFRCVCCQEVVYKPITTECKHNVCKSCLKRSFAAEIYVCPTCRFDLGKDYSLKVNTNLGTILETLFPGYEAAR